MLVGWVVKIIWELVGTQKTTHFSLILIKKIDELLVKQSMRFKNRISKIYSRWC